jgi:ATP-dependent Clp endopeptidase proteolytic subunit ClpP
MTTRLSGYKTQAQDEKFLAEARMFDAQAEKARLESKTAEITLAREKKKDDETAAKNDERNIFHFFGVVDAESVYGTMRVLERFVRLRPDKPVEMFVTSPGGDILAGLALIDHIAQLRRNHDLKITTVALGMAASMAGILMQAGDKRVMGKESWLLIHQASLVVAGSYGEIEDRMDWVSRIQDRIVDTFMVRAKNITRKEFVRKWQRKDWWLSSEEALKYRFIDEVR